jgi:hypothetical protein
MAITKANRIVEAACLGIGANGLHIGAAGLGEKQLLACVQEQLAWELLTGLRR